MGAMIDRAGRLVLAPLACLLLLGACGGSDDGGGKPAQTGPSSTQPAPPLPAAWYEDPDGDLVPTAVEQQIDTDPEVDECAKQAGCEGAGPVSALEQSNTLLILDSSGSMAASAGGGTSKLNAAKGALRRYVAGTPDSLALGFMVYGHKGSNTKAGKARSCAAVELLDPIAKAASTRFDRTLKRFKPTGYTPLGAALAKARDAFTGKTQDINRIILVTDGVETCGGNPVQEARKLKQAGIKVTTDVVGFDVAKPAQARTLRAIAEASGGTYSDARTANDLNNVIGAELDRYDDLAKQYLCITENAAKVSLCQTETVAKGRLYMMKVGADASRAGNETKADEIERLDEKLKAEGQQREDVFKRQSEATANRLKRELDEAERRVSRLNR